MTSFNPSRSGGNNHRSSESVGLGSDDRSEEITVKVLRGDNQGEDGLEIRSLM